MTHWSRSPWALRFSSARLSLPLLCFRRRDGDVEARSTFLQDLVLSEHSASLFYDRDLLHTLRHRSEALHITTTWPTTRSTTRGSSALGACATHCESKQIGNAARGGQPPRPGRLLTPVGQRRQRAASCAHILQPKERRHNGLIEGDQLLADVINLPVRYDAVIGPLRRHALRVKMCQQFLRLAAARTYTLAPLQVRRRTSCGRSCPWRPPRARRWLHDEGNHRAARGR